MPEWILQQPYLVPAWIVGVAWGAYGAVRLLLALRSERQQNGAMRLLVEQTHAMVASIERSVDRLCLKLEDNTDAVRALMDELRRHP